LKIALAQINVVVGDLTGNRALILQAARDAHAQGANLLVTPELALTGYPPEDLLLRPAFLSDCAQALQQLALDAAELTGLTLVVGHPAARPAHADAALPPCINAASVLVDGRVQGCYAKRELPNYRVFDEKRYFASGRDLGLSPLVVPVGGRRVGILICEDAWLDEPGQAAKEAGADLLCVLNASPFHLDKAFERETRMADRARALNLPLLYAHQVGGQDELVFDGCSFAVDDQGGVCARAPMFESALLLVDVDPAGRPSGPLEPIPEQMAQAWQALVVGVRDYVGKNGFPGAIIGLSGGIDSALVLAVAVDALGADRVRTVMMPSAYTADISWIDARDTAERLGVRYQEIAIAPMMAVFEQALAPDFAGLAPDATEENIQARIRGTLLMALSNKTGSIVLTTGNKSEMATGYCTLYGDMAGGFAVIKDVKKTLVYALSEWKNRQPNRLADGSIGAVIPERIITRPPSAELRPDQKDQDSLPPYDVLDAILGLYMEDDRSIRDILALGFQPADVERVTRLIKFNEYKRRQAPPGIRITQRAFGRDWRYPITSRYRA
jgi:NAD+ synthase (glutamine-hydrolysing)